MPVGAACLASVNRRGLDGRPAKVLPVRDGFEMVGVDAMPCPAEMVDRQAFGNWSVGEFVGVPVDVNPKATNTEPGVAEIA